MELHLSHFGDCNILTLLLVYASLEGVVQLYHKSLNTQYLQT